jgi:heat shock protein HslJ
MDLRIRSAGLLFLIPLLVACAAPTPSPTPTPEPFDADGDWLLESGIVDGAAIPIVADYPITFSVDGTQVGGTSACNGYGGRLELIDGKLQFGELGSEAALCGEPDGEVMRSEAAYQQALGRITAGRGEADRLTLFGPTVELVFKRQPPLPIAEIVGTNWLLESVIEGEMVSAAIGEPATLRLEAGGTFHGSTGCRTFTGTWIEAAGRLVATQEEMAGECPGGLAGQDGLVAEGLDGSLPTIEGDRLTLTLNGGNGLVYRRATESFERADIV